MIFLRGVGGRGGRRWTGRGMEERHREREGGEAEREGQGEYYSTKII